MGSQNTLNQQEMLKVVAEWEQEHGPFTTEVRAEARAALSDRLPV